MDGGEWPIRSFKPNFAPPHFLSDGISAKDAKVCNSIVCAGSKVVNADIKRSVLGYVSLVLQGADLDDSILLGDNTIGKNAQLRRTIVDKHAHIRDGTKIGFDRNADEARGFTVSPGGVTVVPSCFRGHR